MKKIALIICCIVLYSCNFKTDKTKFKKQHNLDLQVYAVQLNVTDLDKAINFYSKKIGFEIKSINKNSVELQNEGIKLLLNKVSKLRKTDFTSESRTSLVLHTNDLDSILISFKNKEINIVSKKTENGVGFAFMMENPFGNIISIMEQSKYPVPKFKEPKIYNVGYAMNDLEIAKEFYCKKLGFHVQTTKYLPALPLAHQDSTFAFMLHKKEVKPIKRNPNETQTMLVFSTKNISSAVSLLKKNGVILKKLNNSNKRYLTDPFGNVIKLIESE
jgi:catechol-2,3-dioxygenase